MKDFLECHLSEKYCFLQYVKKTRLLLKNHWQKKDEKIYFIFQQIPDAILNTRELLQQEMVTKARRESTIR